MSTQPTPSISIESTSDSGTESVIGSVTILVYDWAPAQSEIRLLLPTEAQPGEPNAVPEQAKFRARLIADLDDALRELGGP
jgi:hypothetical protein